MDVRFVLNNLHRRGAVLVPLVNREFGCAHAVYSGDKIEPQAASEQVRAEEFGENESRVSCSQLPLPRRAPGSGPW